MHRGFSHDKAVRPDSWPSELWAEITHRNRHDTALYEGVRALTRRRAATEPAGSRFGALPCGSAPIKLERAAAVETAARDRDAKAEAAAVAMQF